MGKRTTRGEAETTSERTKVIGVRLEPKLRYLAELAARKQRRSINSFIEWAIEESLNRVLLQEDSGNSLLNRSVANEGPRLWDVDEPDRFAKLALHYPEMLTHEEQVRWKLIRENGFLWRGRWNPSHEWCWRIEEDALVLKRLRENWEQFCAVARGEADQSILPTWPETRPPPDVDDEPPF